MRLVLSFALLALNLSGLATAQTYFELRQYENVLSMQPVKLTLHVYNAGKAPVTLGGFLSNSIPCPIFKVFDKEGGPPLIERYVAADCVTGSPMTFNAGQRRAFAVTLPMKLSPGEYTAILTLRTQPAQHVSTTLYVGPGPLVTELVLPSGAKAGRPLDLRVASRNVWRTPVTRDLRLCGAGLLIRDGQGKTVYDNKPEGTGCTTDFWATTVPVGGIHLEPWGKLPALPAGLYTAIMWGVDNATLHFEVK
ncbi:hypothetical protein Dxin01_00405 [Deinococcus xinjiangensis]|uniref:P pilus assembly protein, chaperone PapD n=1 Tax=Deinococcus xinjiangensis TaxID=457454 RepID=A0ABP9V7K4_9DEIO